jgi:hypothetical protein
MSNVGKDSSSASDLLKNSSLYREFQAEREQALTDWIIKHRSTWRKNRQAAASN